MSKPGKIILGIFTVLPLVLLMIYFLLFFFFFSGLIIDQMQDARQSYQELPQFLHAFFPLLMVIFIAVFTSIVLMVFYIIHISKNQRFDATQRLLWVMIIIFTSTVGQIAYFILEVWPKDRLNMVVGY